MNTIIHAHPPRVTIELTTSRYTHACLPEHWLSNTHPNPNPNPRPPQPLPPNPHTTIPSPLASTMNGTDHHSITDDPTRTGTPNDVAAWFTRTGVHPDRVINLWLDPISDQLHCTVSYHNDSLFGEPIAGFTIVPAEGAQFTSTGWQPLGDPIPLWPYPGRNAIAHPTLPAPAYYQPCVVPVQHRATHLDGTLRWSPGSGHNAGKRPASYPLRLIAPNLLPHVFASMKKTFRQHPGPMLPYDYDNLRVATKAPPWHLNAGFYSVTPSADTAAAGPAASPAAPLADSGTIPEILSKSL